MTLKILSLSEVKQSITMDEAINAMEGAFIQLAKEKAVLPLRVGVPIEKRGLTLTMPAYLAQEQALGLKIVSIFPENVQQNLAAINGILLLLDAMTGEPLVLRDAGYLTALRTGAVAGLATKYFARNNATEVAIIGSGAQAITQLEAVAAVRNIQSVSIWSRQLKNAEKFAKQLDSRYDIRVCQQIVAAVKDADIICTATGSTEPLVHYRAILPDAHINAIGSHSPMMQEISGEILNKSIVIVDQIEAATIEAGEIINAIATGQLTKSALIEIGSWLLKKTPDYKNQLTIFKSVGLAIQDLSVAQVVYQNALKMNLGTPFKLS